MPGSPLEELSRLPGSDLVALLPGRVLPSTKGPQVPRRHVHPNLTALNGAGILIESEMDSAKHARVVDVVREIVNDSYESAGLARQDARARSECDGPQKLLSDFTRGVTGRRMRRGVARERRRRHERQPRGVRLGARIPVHVAVYDGCDRPPELIEVLRFQDDTRPSLMAMFSNAKNCAFSASERRRVVITCRAAEFHASIALTTAK